MTTPPGNDPLSLLHFVAADPARTGEPVSPLCGAWGRSTSWTRYREVVTCPDCLRLLADAPAELT